tara:strand:+ start:7663 stop:7932 length:270 start_codon:yes stop_codon:yes gene_type:complete
MKFISIPVFIVSLSIGIFIAYISLPAPHVVYVYPTPENIDKIQYKDEGGTCFGFKAKEKPCPKNNKLIRRYPVQTLKKDPIEIKSPSYI